MSPRFGYKGTGRGVLLLAEKALRVAKIEVGDRVGAGRVRTARAERGNGQTRGQAGSDVRVQSPVVQRRVERSTGRGPSGTPPPVGQGVGGPRIGGCSSRSGAGIHRAALGERLPVVRSHSAPKVRRRRRSRVELCLRCQLAMRQPRISTLPAAGSRKEHGRHQGAIAMSSPLHTVLLSTTSARHRLT